MRLVFAGTPETALPSLAALVESRHEVVAVLTRPDARAGRGRQVVQSPVADAADAHGIRVLKPASPRDESLQAAMAALEPDCCPVVAYGGLIPPSVLEIPVHGWVNLHFSILPAWRGAAPVQRALIAGDEVSGATTFRLVEALDAGPTYGVVTETIRPDDTAGTLLDRLATSGASLLVATIDGIEDGILQAHEQAPDGISLAPKLSVGDAEVNWSLPAFAIDRLIRGCTPAPGAWTSVDGHRLKLGPVTLTAGLEPLAAGDVQISKTTVTVGTASEPVELGTVQPQGKPPMRAADWARGLRGHISRLGS